MGRLLHRASGDKALQRGALRLPLCGNLDHVPGGCAAAQLRRILRPCTNQHESPE